MSSYVELYTAAPKTTSLIPQPNALNGIEYPQPTSEMKIGPVTVPQSARRPYGNDWQEAGGHSSVIKIFNRLPGVETAAPQVGPLNMTKITAAARPGE
jgi:hypothetical protein